MVASLQLRKLGRAGVEADVAAWWPLMLRISSERYVVRPERSGESAASPKLFEVYQNPRRWDSGKMLPMWKCCQLSMGRQVVGPHTLAFSNGIDDASSFAKAKHFEPRSFSDAPTR